MDLLVISQRGLQRQPSRSAEFGFEDLLVEWEQARLLAPLRVDSPLSSLVVRGTNAIASTLRLPSLLHGSGRPVDVEGSFDAVLVVAQGLWDLTTLNRVRRWRECSDVRLLWLGEFWRTAIDEPGFDRIEHLLSAFDYVFTPFEHSVDRMHERRNAAFHHVPFGVDAPELAPRQFDHERALDVVSIGRRPADLHRALRQAARSREFSYYYDTYTRPTIGDHLEHRDAHYQLARHSKLWLCYPAKFDTPIEQGGQIEVGPRYYEAVGAGALALGEDAPGRTWAAYLPESMEVRKVGDPSNAAAEISEAIELWPSTLPERVMGVAHTLRQSDWAHRWRHMTRIAGLPAATAVHERIARLDAEAAELLTRWL